MLIFLIIFVICLVTLLAVGGAAVGIYNRLISHRNIYKNAYAQVDVQLKRRYDLIPNLVEVAKGYLKHEHDTLEAVTAARNLAVQQSRAAFISPGQPTSMAGLASAEASLTGALGRLMAVSEAYPDLKANQNMMSLMEELASTENRIAFARQAFNDAVTEYNNLRETFPNSILAGSFNFAPTSLFEASSTETENVKVSF